MTGVLELARLGQEPDSPFPPTCEALAHPNGLLAWGGDLHPRRLLRAYRAGIFPWYSNGQPILWWSPAPRCVLFPENIYLSRRTRRRFNSACYTLSADTAFDPVVRACAEPRDDEEGTWITDDMVSAYALLHDMGYAHSVEVWRDGALAGGIYGLALGRVFFGESMFSRSTDASKIALVALCRHLKQNGYGLLDCQVGNPHLFSMGAEELSREAFESRLVELAALKNSPGNWTDRFNAGSRW